MSTADDQRHAARDFLVSRRAKLTPQQAGLPLYGSNRRVAGLRREEVALLAGVSADYYTKLERGNLAGVSDGVLDAVATALQLDEAERTHLLDLARTANASATRGSRPVRSARPVDVRPGVQLILDGITSTPAYVRNGRMDVLATNRLARALFAEALGGGQTFNLVRYLFLDERSRDFYDDWATVARDSVRALRTEAGRAPYDRGLSDLVGELATRSEDFATWWGSHDVKLHRTATKTMRHPVAGELTLTGEALDLLGDDGLILIAYTVEPGSASVQALAFLASWVEGAAEVIVDPGHAGPALADRRTP